MFHLGNEICIYPSTRSVIGFHRVSVNNNCVGLELRGSRLFCFPVLSGQQIYWRTLFFYKNIVFQTQAGYSYFFAYLRLKIF